MLLITSCKPTQTCDMGTERERKRVERERERRGGGGVKARLGCC